MEQPGFEDARRQSLLSQCIATALDQDDMSRSTSASTSHTRATHGLPQLVEDDVPADKETTEVNEMQTVPINLTSEVKTTDEDLIERAFSAKKRDAEACTSASDPSVQAGTFNGKHDPFANKPEGGVDYKCMRWWYVPTCLKLLTTVLHSQ